MVWVQQTNAYYKDMEHDDLSEVFVSCTWKNQTKTIQKRNKNMSIMSGLTEFKNKFPGYINVQEAARVTTVSPNKITKMIKNKLIKSEKHDTVHTVFYLIPASEIEIIKSYKEKRIYAKRIEF